LPQAQALKELFERLTRFRIDHHGDIAALGTGLAISPSLAATCLREPSRTLASIRGLAAAIDDALLPDRAVRVLYTGCGPYALLAVPLMPHFSRKQAAFTLLDIHPACLQFHYQLGARPALGFEVLGCGPLTAFRAYAPGMRL